MPVTSPSTAIATFEWRGQALCCALVACLSWGLGACGESFELTGTESFEGCEDDGSCVCTSDADCPEGTRCDSTGECGSPLVGCQSDGDCEGELVCVGGDCVEPDGPMGDRDSDGVLDDDDNCPSEANPDQGDLDLDDLGDLCDGDLDGDGLVNGIDNCLRTYNPMQEDPEGTGQGVACFGGDLEAPFALSGAIARQHLDTSARADNSAGSCGGDGAPEVVYIVPMNADEVLSVEVDAAHDTTIQIAGTDATEIVCEAGSSLSFTATEDGSVLLIIDGLAAQDAGPITVRARIALQAAEGAASTVEMGEGPSRVWAGLINDDDAVDMASVNPEQGTVSVRLGTNGGEFGPLEQFNVGLGPVGVWGGDVNRDGHTDLVVALQGEDSVAVLLGDESSESRASFSDPLKIAVGDDPVAVWGGDVNLDGNADLVSVNEADGTVSVLIGDGEGAFGAAESFEVGAGPVAVWGGDVNRDGATDLATANYDGGTGATLSVLMGGGNGTFGAAMALDVGQGPIAVWGGDVNNDGLPELAAVHGGGTVGGVLALFVNEGGGNFAAPVSHDVGAGPVAVWGGDINRDGALDFVTANAIEGTLSVLSGDGEGGLTEARTIASDSPPTYVWGGDINNDTLPELMVAGADGVGVISSKASVFSAPQGLAIEGLEGVWGGDINRDGHTDLAMVNREEGTLSMQLGRGNGTFSESGVLALGDDPLAVWGGDVNRDGGADLAVANRGQIGDTSGAISLFLSEGGTLGEGISLTTDTVPSGIFGDKDYNGDGLPDLAVATRGGDSISLLLATGPGAFDNGHISLPVGNGPMSVWGGDINRDGAMDLASANMMDGTISVLLGDGAGGFDQDQRTDMPVDGANPMSIWGDDLNGDGFIDFSTHNAGSGNMSVLIGEEGSGFSAPDLFATGNGPGTVWGGDLTNDGLPDLATTSEQGVHVFSGYNAGGFTGEQIYDVGDGAVWVWGEDFDRDGAPDLATTGSAGFEVRLSRRTSPLQRAGTRLLDADLPPCPATEVRGQIDVQRGEVHFRVADVEPCRIERLELDVSYDPRRPRGIVISLEGEHLSATETASVLVHSFAHLPPPGLWRPELFAGLARFEGSPARGSWRLRATSGQCKPGVPNCLPVFTRASIIINPESKDPLGAGGATIFCTESADQPDILSNACHWDGGALNGVLDTPTDRDLFLLQGPAEGGVAAGQTITVTMDPSEAAEAPEVALFAYGAARPLLRAQPTEGDTHTLSFTVPEAYDGRYFVVVVKPLPRTSDALEYALSASISED